MILQNIKKIFKTIKNFYDNILHNSIFKKNIKRKYLDENKYLLEVFNITVHIVENIVGKNFFSCNKKIII